jgi:ribonuclease P protein subunit POP4
MKAITKHELIGSYAEIVDSTNKSNIGIKGKIIDETKNTIIIQKKDEKKTLLKNNIMLIIKIENKKYKIQGKILAKRPKDRLK